MKTTWDRTIAVINKIKANNDLLNNDSIYADYHFLTDYDYNNIPTMEEIRESLNRIEKAIN